jgi:hypothetical protein
MKTDWRKSDKQIYLPLTKPELRKIPPFKFFSIYGQGDPNEKQFQENIGILYALSYAIKMSPRNNFAPKNYQEYTVFPLEGIWDLSEEGRRTGSDTIDKSQLIYNLMIRQPDFVDESFALEAIERTKKKKYHPLLERVKFEVIEDNNSIQMMHIGSYDTETESFKKMEDFCLQNGYARESKKHREIYISDFRKVAPDKLKTVLRFKIVK